MVKIYFLKSHEYKMLLECISQILVMDTLNDPYFLKQCVALHYDFELGIITLVRTEKLAFRTPRYATSCEL